MAKVKIELPWNNITEQRTTDGDNGNTWLISNLIEHAKVLPIKDIPMDHLAINFKIGDMNVRELVSHMKLILKADMNYPIILDQDGCIFDGRHRIAKALLEGHETIQAVRFEKDPPASYLNTNKED